MTWFVLHVLDNLIQVKMIIYSENKMAYYSDEFIDDILKDYGRTTLRTISKITEQDPRALTRGISMAAFYDKEGNRICLSKWYGHLFWIELQDSENVLVFEGTMDVFYAKSTLFSLKFTHYP